MYWARALVPSSCWIHEKVLAAAAAPAAAAGSFNSAGNFSQSSAQPDFSQEDMYLGQDHAVPGPPEGGFAHDFDEFGFRYGEACEGYGDY